MCRVAVDPVVGAKNFSPLPYGCFSCCPFLRTSVLPFMAAEIDFELPLDGAAEITNCELKTVHPFKMREWGDRGSVWGRTYWGAWPV